MPKVELTDRFCQAVKCTAGRKTDYFDTLVKGLVLRVSAGGQKSWYAVYGPPARRRWMKLGTYPEIPLGGDNGARQRARAVRVHVIDGTDPLTERKAHEASMAVKDLIDNYVARHASTRRSGREIERRLRKNVESVIGTVKLADLHRRDLTRCIDQILDRGSPTEANKVFEDLRAMVRWARGRGDLDENLTEGMRRPAETVERDRVLTAEEIKALWEALPEADMREGTRRIIRLCLITGQRVGEIAGMTREELDLEAATWTIPASRSKNGREHSVPLPKLAMEVICDQLSEVEALSKRKGRGIPPFVFPGPGARAAVTGAAIAKAVKRQEVIVRNQATIVGIAPWTPHDLRRTAATRMEELGVSPFIVGHVLNHVSVTRGSITSRFYARYDYSREKREALEIWSQALESICGSGG